MIQKCYLVVLNQKNHKYTRVSHEIDYAMYTYIYRTFEGTFPIAVYLMFYRNTSVSPYHVLIDVIFQHPLYLDRFS